MGKREAVDYLFGEEHIPISAACSAVGLSRASYCKKHAGLSERDQIVMDALNQVVGKNVCRGFGLYFAYLRNQGAPRNHKLVWRIYKEIGLNLPRRTRKRLRKIPRVPSLPPMSPIPCWLWTLCTTPYTAQAL